MSVNDQPRAVTDDQFEVLHGESPNGATFIFGNEDHTLGNVLRQVLMRRPETEFCGYSVPHPYDPKMNVRLQTDGTVTALEALKNGLKELQECTNIIDDKFIQALGEYQQKQHK